MDSIGVSNPDIIPDSHMTASSTFDNILYQPEFGRLGDIRGEGWCSLTSSRNDEWLQVYFGNMFTVCRVDTQGDVNGNEWVTAFKLSFSKDGVSWTTYKHKNGTEVVRVCLLRNKSDCSKSIHALLVPLPPLKMPLVKRRFITERSTFLENDYLF